MAHVSALGCYVFLICLLTNAKHVQGKKKVVKNDLHLQGNFIYCFHREVNVVCFRCFGILHTAD